MKELIQFIKDKCSQEEISELVKELTSKEEEENSYPKTWEEFCDDVTEGYYIDIDSKIYPVRYEEGGADPIESRNLFPTREMAESFLAFTQLMSLRQAWIGDWEPNWNNVTELKYCIFFSENLPKIDKYWASHKALSFPTNEMAEDFLNCFGDLIKQAKLLI